MKKMIPVLMGLVLAPILAIADREGGEDLSKEDYHYEIVKYGQKSGEKNFPATLYVKPNGLTPHKGGVPTIVGKAKWFITRHENMISAEVRDGKGNPITISSTEEGSNLRVTVPHYKQILNCNAPGKSNFVMDPSAYNGEFIRLNQTHYINPELLKVLRETLRGFNRQVLE